MTIQIPQVGDAFLETVGCCWHLKESDGENIATVKGTTVSLANIGERKAFCRCVIDRGRFRSSVLNVIHVHVEVAAEGFFSSKLPEVSGTLGEIGERLTAVLGNRKFETSTITCGFRIPAQQIAAGSALSSIFGLQARLHSEHQAVLTRGTLLLVSTINNDDTLTFELNTDDGKAYAAISANGAGEDTFALDCLMKAASRMTAVFNKLVLAKDDILKHEGASNE